MLTFVGASCGSDMKLVDEMDKSYAISQSNADVSAVVGKYIKQGDGEDILNLFLKRLDGEGFAVSEYRFNGARRWPNGVISAYADEVTRRNMANRIPVGSVRFVAEIEYASSFLVARKKAVVVVTVKEAAVQSVEGRISISGI
jgi:hypothetical protein